MSDHHCNQGYKCERDGCPKCCYCGKELSVELSLETRIARLELKVAQLESASVGSSEWPHREGKMNILECNGVHEWMLTQAGNTACGMCGCFLVRNG